MTMALEALKTMGIHKIKSHITVDVSYNKTNTVKFKFMWESPPLPLTKSLKRAREVTQS